MDLLYIVSVGTQEQIYIGPWTLSKEAQWSENRSIVRKMPYFELHEHAMTIKAGKGGPRRDIPLAKWNKDQNMCPIIEEDVPESSIDKDMHCERIRQMRAKKCLRESCYHRIEYFIANSLATLMRKWCLNSAFQPYSYYQRLQEGANGISINRSNLMSTWRVEMRGECGIK